jgi:hypothetical protein
LHAKSTTGLTEEQFDELHRLIAEEFVWDTGKGRPRCLDLRKALAASLMYFKANVTEEFIAAQFETSQPSISRIIAAVETMIAAVLGDCVPDLHEALRGSSAVIDGSLLPCWSWADHPELWSGKHKTTGHNCQMHQPASKAGWCIYRIRCPDPFMTPRLSTSQKLPSISTSTSR